MSGRRRPPGRAPYRSGDGTPHAPARKAPGPVRTRARGAALPPPRGRTWARDRRAAGGAVCEHTRRFAQAGKSARAPATGGRAGPRPCGVGRAQRGRADRADGGGHDAGRRRLHDAAKADVPRVASREQAVWRGRRRHHLLLVQRAGGPHAGRRRRCRRRRRAGSVRRPCRRGVGGRGLRVRAGAVRRLRASHAQALGAQTSADRCEHAQATATARSPAPARQGGARLPWRPAARAASQRGRSRSAALLSRAARR